MKFHKNPSCEGPVPTCGETYGRTDGHDEANSHISELSDHAYKYAPRSGMPRCPRRSTVTTAY
jgi:hypothetical protein